MGSFIVAPDTILANRNAIISLLRKTQRDGRYIELHQN